MRYTLNPTVIKFVSVWGLDLNTVKVIVCKNLMLEGQPVSGYQLENAVYADADCANLDSTLVHELRHVWQSRNGHEVTAYCGTQSASEYANSSSERDARLAEARYKYSVKPNARLETLIKNLAKYELE